MTHSEDYGRMRAVAAIAIERRNKRESPLFRLPGELLIQIYEYALGGLMIRVAEFAEKLRSRNFLTAWDLYGNRGSNSLAVFTSLTIASRQLYAETRLLVLRLNEFSITLKAFHALDKILYRDRMNEIRTVRLSWPLARMLEFDCYELLRETQIGVRRPLAYFSYAAFQSGGFELRAAMLGKLVGLKRIVITDWPSWQARDGKDTQDMSTALRSLAGKQVLEMIMD